MLLKHKQWYCASSANPITIFISNTHKPNGEEFIFIYGMGNAINVGIAQYSVRCASYVCVGSNESETKTTRMNKRFKCQASEREARIRCLMLDDSKQDDAIMSKGFALCCWHQRRFSCHSERKSSACGARNICKTKNCRVKNWEQRKCPRRWEKRHSNVHSALQHSNHLWHCKHMPSTRIEPASSRVLGAQKSSKPNRKYWSTQNHVQRRSTAR